MLSFRGRKSENRVKNHQRTLSEITKRYKKTCFKHKAYNRGVGMKLFATIGAVVLKTCFKHKAYKYERQDEAFCDSRSSRRKHASSTRSGRNRHRKNSFATCEIKFLANGLFATEQCDSRKNMWAGIFSLASFQVTFFIAIAAKTNEQENSRSVHKVPATRNHGRENSNLYVEWCRFALMEGCCSTY